MKTLNEKFGLFPQQYVIGPKFVDCFEFGKKYEIAPSFLITSHPELNVSNIVLGHRSLTLIGYILDPNKPDHDNFQVIEELLLENSSFEEVVESTFELCGNWILLYKEDQQVFLFHDCTGVRSLFYTDGSRANELWFASQPRLIASFLGLQEDKEAHDFMKVQKEQSVDYWWPGNSSPYSEIKALLPNHYFDAQKREVIRYWPDRNLRRLESQEAREQIASRLEKIMVAASHRFELALALSGGWDSRVMLAASKNIKEKICVYNGKRPEMPSRHPDILIPRRLTSKLKIKYHYIPQSNDIDTEFVSAFEMNAPDPAKGLMSGLFAELRYFNREKVGVTGNILEIARFFYKITDPSGTPPSGKTLSFLTKMQNSPFAINAFNCWLSSVSGNFNVNVYDLFYWEQRCGRWLSNNSLVFSMAWKEVFFPFNCRNLMRDLLSVLPQDRMPTDYAFFKNLMLDMWSEVLSEPINPTIRTQWYVSGFNKVKKMFKFS